MHLHLVELDGAAYDVLGAFGGDLSLVGHAEEGQVVDVENEGVSLHVIVERNFPFQLLVLHRQWKRAWLIKFFTIKFV